MYVIAKLTKKYFHTLFYSKRMIIEVKEKFTFNLSLIMAKLNENKKLE